MTTNLIQEESATGRRRVLGDIEELLGSLLISTPAPDTICRPSNLVETWGSYILQIALPGIEPDRLEVAVVARQVTVTGRHHLPVVEGGEDVWREIPSGPFEETFRLPAEVDGDHAEACYARGVLTIRLPKVAHLKPQFVPVQVTD